MIEVLLSIKSKSAVFRKKNNQLCTVLLAFSFDMDGRKSKIDLKMTCIRSLKLLGMGVQDVLKDVGDKLSGNGQRQDEAVPGLDSRLSLTSASSSIESGRLSSLAGTGELGSKTSDQGVRLQISFLSVHPSSSL